MAAMALTWKIRFMAAQHEGRRGGVKQPVRQDFGVAKRVARALISRMMQISELIELLRRREDIIADHAWRDRDGEGHLEALRDVSESIGAWNSTHRAAVDAQLRHFLTNASYAKALAHAVALQDQLKGN